MVPDEKHVELTASSSPSNSITERHGLGKSKTSIIEEHQAISGVNRELFASCLRAGIRSIRARLAVTEYHRRFAGLGNEDRFLPEFRGTPVDLPLPERNERLFQFLRGLKILLQLKGLLPAGESAHLDSVPSLAGDIGRVHLRIIALVPQSLAE